MKSLMIFIALTALIGCSETDEMDKHNHNIYASLGFSVFNVQDEDLLNPETPGHLNTEDIRLFYVINGESQEFFNENLDYPRGYLIGEHQGVYRIEIFLNHAETEDRPITYIKWNDVDTDTIEVSYRRTEQSIVQETIWLNGEPIWEIGHNTIDPYFVLEK